MRAGQHRIVNYGGPAAGWYLWKWVEFTVCCALVHKGERAPTLPQTSTRLQFIGRYRTRKLVREARQASRDGLLIPPGLKRGEQP